MNTTTSQTTRRGIGFWGMFLLISTTLAVFATLATRRATARPNRTQQYVTPSAFMRVPLSGASWVNPEEQPAAQPPPSNDERLKRLEEKVDRILKLLEDDSAAPQPPAEDTKSQAQLQAALSTCVGCHNDRDAAKKGDRFVLFNVNKDGQSVFRDDFDKRELRKIQNEVTDGTMPRKSSGKKLTPEQKTALLDEIKVRTVRADQ